MTSVEFAVLRGGFIAAAERFGEEKDASPAGSHALFETLAWVGVVRDRLKPDEPLIVRGLYYARNIVLHEGADVLAFALYPGPDLYPSETLYPGFRRVSRWPMRHELPPPRSSTGAHEYDRLVAGREVGNVLAEVALEIDQD